MKGTKQYNILHGDLTIGPREETLRTRHERKINFQLNEWPCSAVSDDTFALLGENVPHDGSHTRELQGLSAL